MNRRILLRLIVLLLVAGLAWYKNRPSGQPAAPAAMPGASAIAVQSADAQLARAFETHARDLRVQDRGTVSRVLPDDTTGSRHQRFILRLDNGQSILIAHNIDLAPRLEPLRVGDSVAFSGEYAWSAQGGVVHWTHRDPSGRHVAGWLRVGEQLVQ